MTTVLICLLAAFFLGMGMYAFFAPGAILRPFGFTVQTPQTRSEVRAVYGGFGVAIASALVAALASADLRPGALMTVGAALAGMAGGRVISRLVDASTPFYPVWFYFLVETAGASASFAAAAIG